MANPRTLNEEASSQRFGLEFSYPSGKFSITPSAQQDGVYLLKHESEQQKKPEELGAYQAINDVILAVLRQETGLSDWDQLPPEEIPHKVHDIASWTFTEIAESEE